MEFVEQAVFAPRLWPLDRPPWQFHTHRYADPPPLICHWQLVLKYFRY